MTWLALMYVAIGGAVGSMARYAAMSLIGGLSPGTFPYGTLAVNIAGSFLMGVWIAYTAAMMPSRAKDLHLLFAVGVLGGFTTFSTFSLDTFFLIQRGEFVQAGAYVFGSVLISLAALMGGMWLLRNAGGA